MRLRRLELPPSLPPFCCPAASVFGSSMANAPDSSAGKPGGGEARASTHLVDRFEPNRAPASSRPVWSQVFVRVSLCASRALVDRAHPPPWRSRLPPLVQKLPSGRCPSICHLPHPHVHPYTILHQLRTWTPCPSAAQLGPPARLVTTPMRRRQRLAPCSHLTPRQPAPTSLTTSCWPSQTQPP